MGWSAGYLLHSSTSGLNGVTPAANSRQIWMDNVAAIGTESHVEQLTFNDSTTNVTN